MAKIIFNKQKNIDAPTLLLQNRNFDTLGIINNVYNLEYEENFNAGNILKFNIHRDNSNFDIWEEIIDFKIIYIPEFNERFEINISTTSTNTITKSVTTTSLCESELSQINLYNIEINTESDMLNDEYDEDFPTLFYRNPEDYSKYDWSDFKYRNYTIDDKRNHIKHASLLHRILEKAEHYSIGHIDTSLKEIKKVCSFSISDTDIYNELVGEISEQYNCIFLFDSMTRTISAYDLYNTCEKCGYRGDFSEFCPECGEKEFSGQYGKDTTVFISNENLSQEISLESNKDSLKNCFYVEGGDEIITAAIRAINPNGTNYFYEFNFDTLKDMPTELSSTIEKYNDLYHEYTTTKKFPLNQSLVNNYNNIVSSTNALFSTDNSIHFELLKKELIGYPSVISAIYEAIDLYEFLDNTMMPTINIDGLGIEDSIRSIVSGFSNGFSTINNNGTVTTSFSNQIAVKNPTTATQSTVENTIKNSAKMFYSSAYYTLDVNTLSYVKSTSSTNGNWRGTVTLTSRTETDDNGEKLSLTSTSITLTIIDNVELYTEQKIYHNIGKMDEAKYSEIASLKMDFNTFKNKILLYSLNELENLKEAFRACLDIIISADIIDKSLYNRYYNFYNERYNHIDRIELPKRISQLEDIEALYYFDSGTNESSGILYDITVQANKDLNLKEYVLKNPLNYNNYNGDKLWKTYCSYRREEKYTNSNYVSDGLSNAEVIEKAQELIDVAQKELYKASHLQYTLSSSMDNLLALEEFQPLIDSFDCGNWIRIGFEDNIYKLRLLSYQIKFDDISSIDVEFSTVENIYYGNSDLESILDSAKCIAGSYSYTAQQANNSAKYSKYVENWVQKGMDATATKIVNNAENQDILIDRNGLLCRKYDDIENVYDPCQSKYINNGLYITDDNWNTIKTGIGKFIYLDPKNNFKENVGYGVIADIIHSDIVLTSEVGVYSQNGGVIIDGSGITLDGGKITWTHPINSDNSINSNAVNGLDLFKTNLCQSLGLSTTVISPDSVIAPKIGGGYLYIYNPNTEISVEINPLGTSFNGHNSSYVFNVCKNNSVVMGVTSNGDGYFNGKISASSGSIIGNLSVGVNKITYGHFGIDTSSTDPNNIALWLGNATATSAPFRVSYNGKLCCSNADISGKISATSGSIGGFTIGSNYIANNTNTLGTTENSVYVGNNGISCGNKFKVDNNGNATASSLIVSGGEISGSSISATSLIKMMCFRMILAGGANTWTYEPFVRSLRGTISPPDGVPTIPLESPYMEIGGSWSRIDFLDNVYCRSGLGAQTIYEGGTSLYYKYLSLSGGTLSGNMVFINGRFLRGTDLSDNVVNLIGLNSNENIHIGTYGDSDTTKAPVYIHAGGSQYDFGSTNLCPNVSKGLSLGNSDHLWKTIYAETGTINTSDRNKKHSISDIPEKYMDLFWKLKPKIYMLNGGDRIHVGAISQDVEEAMEEINLTSKEFGGFCKDIHYEYEEFDEDGNGIEDSKKPVLDESGNLVYDYSMRYQEFIFLCVEAIQRQKKDLEDQTQMISNLNNEIGILSSENKTLQDEISSIKEQINSIIANL